MCWDTLATRTMTVCSSEEDAQKLVEKYSEQYPDAYFDYVYSLWLLQLCHYHKAKGHYTSTVQHLLIKYISMY